jgi:GDPmannose 4,6-dehydratase
MKALVTGIAGQDGYYLAQYLDTIGYDVVGLNRRSSAERLFAPDCDIFECDITDAAAVSYVVSQVKPDEIYNLAAQSHVGESFKIPEYTYRVNAIGALNVLNAAKDCGSSVYQASTSELFGNVTSPQNESTNFHPRSPYAVSKLAAYWQTVNYREAYGMKTANGILFNHESPRRGLDFVTRKVCRAVARIHRGLQSQLMLGNLDSRRDWGHAKDYVKAMHIAMKHGGEFVVATGESHSIRELCELAFSHVRLNWKDYVQTDPAFMRPADVIDLRGDSSKIRKLGWAPEYTFDALIAEMMETELCAMTS